MFDRDCFSEELDAGQGMIFHPIQQDDEHLTRIDALLYDASRCEFYSARVTKGRLYFDYLGRIGDIRAIYKKDEIFPFHWTHNPWTGAVLRKRSVELPLPPCPA